MRDQLIARLKPLGVEVQVPPGRDDGFAGLSYKGKDFAHFHSHNDNELDIRLTKAVIKREGLAHPPSSTVHPKRSKTSNWIEVRFHTEAELDRVVELVGIAIGELKGTG